MSEQSLTLTRRQLQLLQLIEAGQGNRDIAEQLQISEHTVKVHMWRMFKKLGVGSRTGALAKWKAQNPDELTTVRAQRDRLLVALQTAIDHIDMGALKVSHCKDAALIRAAIDDTEGGAE